MLHKFRNLITELPPRKTIKSMLIPTIRQLLQYKAENKARTKFTELA